MKSKIQAEQPQGRPLTWSLMQRADDPDIARAHQQLKDDIADGATGVSLIFEGAHNAFGYGLPANTSTIADLFDGIDLNDLHIRLDNHPHGGILNQALVDYLHKRQINPARTKFTFCTDPVAVLASTGHLKMSVAALKASLPQSMSLFFSSGLPGIVLEADGRPYHNAGATSAQELGAILSIAVGHLRMVEEARHHIAYALPHIGFATALDQDPIAGRAKMRALRSLWRRFQEQRKVPTPVPATIHVESSMRMMESGDILSNITRSSLAAYAAITGGASSVSLLPHTITVGLPEKEARRIALNNQRIMALEGETAISKHANRRAADADSLAEAAWVEFERLEKEGGVMQSLIDGNFAKRINEARELRLANYLRGEQILIGADKPAGKDVDVLDAKPSTFKPEGIEYCPPLVLARWQEELAEAQNSASIKPKKAV